MYQIQVILYPFFEVVPPEGFDGQHPQAQRIVHHPVDTPDRRACIAGERPRAKTARLGLEQHSQNQVLDPVDRIKDDRTAEVIPVGTLWQGFMQIEYHRRSCLFDLCKQLGC